MKRLIVFTFCLLLATGCSRAKDAADQAENKVKARGACLILETLQKNYSEALSGTPLAESAGGQFKNGLEALKPLVPQDVQDAVTTLRATEAPVDPNQYTPEQAQARQTIDAHFQKECGQSLS